MREFGYSETLLNLLPIREDLDDSDYYSGHGEALWIARVCAPDCKLDLFGFGEPIATTEQGRTLYGAGELRYVLRGRNTSLAELVPRAERLWSQFSGHEFVGRQPGLGMWASADVFIRALARAVEAVRVSGHKVTQEEVAAQLSCDAHQIRHWLKKFYGMGWADFMKSL